MAEYMFLVTRVRHTAAQRKRYDNICRAAGGYGYTEVTDRSLTQGYPALGWMTGPNLGDPFDRDLAARVRAQLGDDY